MVVIPHSIDTENAFLSRILAYGIEDAPGSCCGRLVCNLADSLIYSLYWVVQIAYFLIEYSADIF